MPETVVPEIVIETKDDINTDVEMNLSPVSSPEIFTTAIPDSPHDDFIEFPELSNLDDIVEDPNVDEIFAEDEQGNKVLRAATFDKIVKWIAFENTNDKDLEAFFVAYQMASTARDMFDLFVQIHGEYIENPEYDKLEINGKAERFIYALVASGIIDKDIIPSISVFASKNFSSTTVSDLKMNLMKYKHSISLSESPVSVALASQNILNSLVKLQKLPSDGKIPSYPEDGILAFSSSHLAENLTLIESELFSRIERNEYFHHTKPHLSPNITLFANHFNMVSSWVAAEIFSAEQIRQVPVLKKFINLSVKLLEMKNFNGTMEILCGLNNSSLQRYKKIWDALPARYSEVLKQIEETLSPSRNFRNYRNSLAAAMNANQPVVPYLAGHLKDLIFADEGNSSSKGLTSFEKISMVGNIINSLLKAAKSLYPFQPREEDLQFITNLWWMSSDDLRSCSCSYQQSTHSSSNGDIASASNPSKEAFVEKIFDLTTKQRIGSYGYTKEVHNHIYDIAKLLYSMHDTLNHTTRIWRGTIILDCFSGWQAVNCIISAGLCDSRRAAIEIGQQLLRDNYIKPCGKTNTFQDKFGAWYQWTTEEIPGFEERELRDAQKVTEIQERTDRCILIAISSSTGGIQPELYWSGMNAYFCFTGSSLVAWLADNMKIPRAEALDLCSRLFSRQLIIPVVVSKIEKTPHNEEFLDSESHFYQFGLIRPRQIQKQPESQIQEKPEAKNRRKLRKKLKSTSLYDDMHISREEARIILQMTDAFSGVPLEDGPVKAWNGAEMISWFQNKLHISELEAAKLASSLHERKILVNPLGANRKLGYSKGASCFYLSQAAIILCELQQEGGKISVTNEFRPSNSGPVLYERSKTTDNPTAETTDSTTKEPPNDPAVQETYSTVSLLLELLHPTNGIKRSDVRLKSHSRKLFSGTKFVTWLETNKNLTRKEAIEIFNDFASRGLLVTLHDAYAKEYSPDTMYRFSIEKGDGMDRIPRAEESSNTRPSVTNAGETKNEQPSETTPPNNSPSVQKSILQSRMGGIENPNNPIKRPKARRRKSEKASVDHKIYIAPRPAILSRRGSSSNVLDVQAVTGDTSPRFRAGTTVKFNSSQPAQPSPIRNSHKSESIGHQTTTKEAETREALKVDSKVLTRVASEGKLTPKLLKSDDDTQRLGLTVRSITSDSLPSMIESKKKDSPKDSPKESPKASPKPTRATLVRERSMTAFARFTNKEEQVSENPSSTIDEACAHKLWEGMSEVKSGLELKVHKVKKKTYTNSFSGTEACTWLNEYISKQPGMQECDPLTIAQDLLSWGYFISLNNKDKSIFEAGNINFYQLQSKKGYESLKIKKRKRKRKTTQTHK